MTLVRRIRLHCIRPPSVLPQFNWDDPVAPYPYTMIIPDEDTKDASGPHSPTRLAVNMGLAYEIANEAGSSRGRLDPGPVNEESEADLADPLPPYTPRETDPLLGSHWNHRKKKRRRRIWSNVSGLLLVGAFTGLLTYNIVDGWRSHRDRVGAGVRNHVACFCMFYLLY
jgi:hypothetical protein